MMSIDLVSLLQLYFSESDPSIFNYSFTCLVRMTLGWFPIDNKQDVGILFYKKDIYVLLIL